MEQDFVLSLSFNIFIPINSASILSASPAAVYKQSAVFHHKEITIK
jgi:hypothetical protein